MPAHKRCKLFYPLYKELAGSALKRRKPLVLRSGAVSKWLIGCSPSASSSDGLGSSKPKKERKKNGHCNQLPQSISIKPLWPLNRAKSAKIGYSQTFRFWIFVPTIFGFWLFTWWRCGRVVKKSSKKDSWYQDYSESVLLTASSPSFLQQLASLVSQLAPNIWTQAVSILVERTNNQNIEVFLLW